MRAIARVHSLASRRATITSAPIAIAPLTPIEPVSATGQLLSREVMAVLEDAVRAAAAAASLNDALEIGYRAFAASACTAAAREGIQAHQEGRKPDFSKTG
jgi:enoyl-CoA hydratase / 3-hydroxyacyl-CoA dehydrogenase